ncbi:hypothetical protein [Spongiactinospora sp. 9N601]|uniref:hypothetical protein n=1 Tax=Spongiactinospora sp. 9N601 TaxID=3375149 RepID=UPI0037911FD4
MTMLVHVTAAKNVRSIRRSGIRAVSGGWDGTGVYCLPVLPSYQITHQWVRELRRGGQRAHIAVYFRVPDDEPVQVGHYNSLPAHMGSAEAAALIAAQPDPRGYEVFIPRSVRAGEIHRIRRVNRLTGWRYMPDAHGRPPCACPICNPKGQYGAAEIRAKFGDPDDINSRRRGL